MSQLDSLDEIARAVLRGDLTFFDALSTGERVYVALAADQLELLRQDGYSLVEALERLGPAWTEQLLLRWGLNGLSKL